MQSAVTPTALRVPNARWLRLIPVAMIVYVISFMDRTNISYAFEGMGRDLGIDKTAQGLAGGIFFIGYLFLQIPGGMLAERWSAKRFVGVMIVLWGAMACLEGLVQNFTQLLIVRFLLGVAEGGIWPAILVLISHWFPSKERARAYAFWMANLAISSIITQPLSGAIVSSVGWRGLFIIEGILPFVIAAPLWWAFIADRPEDATWLSSVERAYIARETAADRRAEPPPMSMRSALLNVRVWQFVASVLSHSSRLLWTQSLAADAHQSAHATGLCDGRSHCGVAIRRRDRRSRAQRGVGR